MGIGHLSLSLIARRQLNENETRKYIRQIVSAVDHMHRAHVIHRDIKLQNFMLDENYDIIIIGRDRFGYLVDRLHDELRCLS